MNSTRKIAVITGVLFIIATLMGPILARPLIPDLNDTDYLTHVSAHPNQVAQKSYPETWKVPTK